MIFWREKEISRPEGYLDGVLDGNSGKRVHPGDMVLILETKQLGFASGDQATWLRFDSLID
jgi:hypothetical protein